MQSSEWVHVAVNNPPFSTRMRRSRDGQYVFLDSVDFRIHAMSFSNPEDACIAGAYACEIASDLRRLDQQDVLENDALMKRIFPSASDDIDAVSLGGDAAGQLDLDTSSFAHCAILWGPEPFDGFLSCLIRLSKHDIFIGPARGEKPSASPHVFVFPSGAYRQHLIDVLSHL